MSAKDELLIHADQTNKWLRSPHSLFCLICLICVYLWPNGFFSQLLPSDGTDLIDTESRDAHRRATRCRGKGAELIFQLGQHCLV